jgi:hypothetical protein
MAIYIGIEFGLGRFEDGDTEVDTRGEGLAFGNKAFDYPSYITGYNLICDNRTIFHVAVVGLLCFENQGSSVIVDLKCPEVGSKKT